MSDKLNPGDSPLRGPLNTAAWNRVVDGADVYQNREARGVAPPPRPAWLSNYQTIAGARNDTGANLRRGDVVEFATDVLLLELSNDEPYLSAQTPDLTRAGWGIMLDPALHQTSTTQDVGRCLINGVCLANVAISSPLHRYARREAGRRVLVSADRGAVKILQTGGELADEAGVKQCLAHIVDDTPLWYFGIVRKDYTQGGDDQFIELDIYTRDLAAGKWKKRPGGVLLALDWYLNKDETLEKNTKVRADWYINCWAVTGMYCTPTDLDEFLPSPSTGSPGEMEAGGDPPADPRPIPEDEP